MAKAIIALINLLEDDTELALLAAKYNLEIPIPRTYNEAVNDPNYSQQQKDTIQEEINSLVANRTWTEEIRPEHANLVSTKWVFTVKPNPDGTLERFKARLVT